MMDDPRNGILQGCTHRSFLNKLLDCETRLSLVTGHHMVTSWKRMCRMAKKGQQTWNLAALENIGKATRAEIEQRLEEALNRTQQFWLGRMWTNSS